MFRAWGYSVHLSLESTRRMLMVVQLESGQGGGGIGVGGRRAAARHESDTKRRDGAEDAERVPSGEKNCDQPSPGALRST